MKDRVHAGGIVAMLVERFEGQHLARLLDIKAALEEGELLGDYNSAFLADLFEETRNSKQMVDRHPEYQTLYARAVRLYREIAAQALANEIRGSPQDNPSRAAS